MRIINYYRGSTDKLSGFVYDTDAKTYKEFAIAGKDWTEEYVKNNTYYSRHKKNFKIPADIDYFFPTKSKFIAHRASRCRRAGCLPAVFTTGVFVYLSQRSIPSELQAAFRRQNGDL